VIGDNARVGAGAVVRDAVLLEGAEVPPAGMIAGGIAGRVAKP
jgi:acetyltransferase-like isoleucine patch superfamily enzyme